MNALLNRVRALAVEGKLHKKYKTMPDSELTKIIEDTPALKAIAAEQGKGKAGKGKAAKTPEAQATSPKQTNKEPVAQATSPKQTKEPVAEAEQGKGKARKEKPAKRPEEKEPVAEAHLQLLTLGTSLIRSFS